MALSFDTLAAHAILDALRLHIDAQAGETAIRIYAGTAPASVTDPVGSATLLATATFPNPCAVAASNKTLTFTNPPDTTASETGDASFFRIVKPSVNNKAIFQGTVTTSASNGDLKVNKINFVKDEPVRIVEFKISLP